MKKTWIYTGLILAAALGASPSQAADWGYKDGPAPVWRGFYFGLNAGGLLQGESDFSFEEFGPGQTNKVDMRGMAGGLHLGYNAQYGIFVAGLEGDAGFASTDTLTQGTSYINGVAVSQVNGLGSVRGRLGVTLRPDFLAYGTGGLALADISHSLDYGGELFKDGNTVAGAVYGAGFEYLYTGSGSRLSFGMEVLHYDFGSDRFVLDNKEGNAIPADLDTSFTTVRGRVSLHLD
jgi:outer membrane immunogenic protein